MEAESVSVVEELEAREVGEGVGAERGVRGEEEEEAMRGKAEEKGKEEEEVGGEAGRRWEGAMGEEEKVGEKAP